MLHRENVMSKSRRIIVLFYRGGSENCCNAWFLEAGKYILAEKRLNQYKTIPSDLQQIWVFSSDEVVAHIQRRKSKTGCWNG